MLEYLLVPHSSVSFPPQDPGVRLYTVKFLYPVGGPLPLASNFGMCHLGFAFCIPNSIDVNTFEHFCPVWEKKSSFYLFFWCFVGFFFHLANLRGNEGYWGAISDGSSLLTRNLLRCLANT